MEWYDSADYLQELTKFLLPLQQTVCWTGCWHSHTDLDHFQPIIDTLSLYTTIKGKRVLDSGCGTAGLLIALQRMGAGELIGIELDPNVYSLAKLRTQSLPQVFILHDDAQCAQLADESFDIIISHHVIEHVGQFGVYLANLKRLMKPGGLLWIACPNRLWFFEAHSQLPLIHYLPRSFSKFLGTRIERATFLPARMRDRGRTSTLYETDFTCFRLKRMLRRYSINILELNHPRHLSSQLTAHGFNWLGRLIQKLPLRLQRNAAMLLADEIRAVCRSQS
jgi:2-polyprenyl-3-methyl-5-hydroxy-6-metoxy-1,4-benzoquinol methylase